MYVKLFVSVLVSLSVVYMSSLFVCVSYVCVSVSLSVRVSVIVSPCVCVSISVSVSQVVI